MGSVILNNPARMVALVLEAAPPELKAADREALSLSSLLKAYRAAQKVEARKPLAELAKSGTWSKYMRVVDNLARQRPHDPFWIYRHRCQEEGWSSKNTRQGARSALARYATALVTAHLPLYLRVLYKALPEAEDQTLLRRILQRHRHLGLEVARRVAHQGMVDTHLVELARAARFLNEAPPDPEGQRLRASEAKPASDKEKRHGSKRGDLRPLLRLENRRRKRDPEFGWCTALWNCVEREGCLFDQMIMIALLMLTGCRPAELMHPEGVWLRAERIEGEPALAVVLNGAKVSDGEEEVPKGQPKRLLRLACRTPEAEWLWHWLSHGLGRFPLAHWDLEEGKQGVLLRPKARVVPADGKRHPAISSLDKTLVRFGKIAFPRLETAITPYTLRHALAAEAKAEGYDREALARLLGHASTRTASGYGATGQGKRRSQRAAQILEVCASREPRLTHRRPPRQRPEGPPKFDS